MRGTGIEEFVGLMPKMLWILVNTVWGILVNIRKQNV